MKLFCPKCDRQIAKIGCRAGRKEDGVFVAWCSECERVFLMSIHDFGSDPIQMMFEQMVATDAKKETVGPNLSEKDVLAIANGWLDQERFACDLTGDEKVSCDIALDINKRRQRELEGRE